MTELEKDWKQLVELVKRMDEEVEKVKNETRDFEITDVETMSACAIFEVQKFIYDFDEKVEKQNAVWNADSKF